MTAITEPSPKNKPTSIVEEDSQEKRRRDELPRRLKTRNNQNLNKFIKPPTPGFHSKSQSMIEVNKVSPRLV